MTRPLSFLFVLLMLLAPLAAAAAPGDPVKLSDVRDLRQTGKTVENVLVAMSERGVAIRMTASAERKLKDMGFTEEDLGHVKRIIKGEKYEPKAEDEPDADDAPGDNPADPKANDPNDKNRFPIGHGHDAQYAKTMAKVLDRGLGAVRVNYRAYPLDRATLYCSAGKSKQVLPHLQGIEKAFVNNLPACLSNSTGPKTTLFIVTDTRKDFLALIKSLTLSYDKEWPGYKRRVRMTNDTTYKIFSNAMFIDGSAIKGGDLLKRYLAFSWGYMAAEQISEYNAPDALRMGMGNLVERLYMRTPSIVLFSDSGDEDDEIADWQGFAQERVQKKDLPKIDAVLGFTSDRMHNAHYAVSWSFTEHLAKDPLALYTYLDSLGKEDAPVQRAHLSKAYSQEIDAMFEAWKKSIAGQ